MAELEMTEPSPAYQQLKRKVRMRLSELLETNGQGDPHARLDRETVVTQLQTALRAFPNEIRQASMTPTDQEALVKELTDEVIGVGPLEPLMGDPEISEIMVNGPSQVFVERNGRIEPTKVAFRDSGHLMMVIERLLDMAGATVNESDPCVDASLPNGDRLNVVLPPITPSGPTMTIRKRMRQMTAADILKRGSISAKAAEFLTLCVRARINMVLAGGTSTGKTTLVSILSTAIPPDERVVTIENVAELELPNCPHWVRMVGRAPNAEGRGEISLRTLVKNALRMRPDRIILGEARGGEALDIIQAMQTGHDGVLTILHANSPMAALERLETLMLMSGLDIPLSVCKQQVASAVELIIQLSRFPDGSRRIESICQVAGVSPEGFLLEELFATEMDAKGQAMLQPTDVQPRFTKKFARYNLEVPGELFQRG